VRSNHVQVEAIDHLHLLMPDVKHAGTLFSLLMRWELPAPVPTAPVNARSAFGPIGKRVERYAV